MKRLNRVLCAVDVKDADREVFAHALGLARRSGAALRIVHAASPVRPLSDGATERVDFLRRLRAEAEAARVEVRVDVQRGDVARVIRLHAASRNADIIVLGAGRARSQTRLDTIAERVARAAGCPTLVVPRGSGATDAPSPTLLCAVDFSTESEAAVHESLSLAASGDSRVVLAHVVDGPDPDAGIHYPWLATHDYFRSRSGAALEQLQALIPPDARPRVLARVAIGSPAVELLRIADGMQPQLIVMGARRRNRIAGRLFGTTAELLSGARCPVLAVPAPAAVRAGDPVAAPAAA